MKTLRTKEGMVAAGRAGTPLPAAARTECAPYHPNVMCCRTAAFTLIELLVVISIIGIIAAMVLGLGSLASRKKHDAVASAVVNRLVLMIENYQSKLGYYPPDNASNAPNALLNLTGGTTAYETSTAQNQLLYELTGASQLPPGASSPAGSFLAFNGTNLTTTALQTAFGRGGIANSNPDEPHSFYNPLPKVNDYTNFGGSTLSGLIVSLSLPGNSGKPNYLHYDSSSSARHNSGSFDLWVEFDGGSSSGNTITNVFGNW